MTKVYEVVVDVLEDLFEKESEAPIEKDDAKTVIRALNDYMFYLEARDICLGYTKVSNTDDEVTVHEGAMLGIKAQVAINLAPKFKAEVSQELRTKAKEGFKAILDLALDVPESVYPDTLPRGSGSNYSSSYGDVFFTGTSD